MNLSEYIKKTALFFLMGILTVGVSAQTQNPGVEKLSEVFLNGATDFAKNKVFIKTDKDIYCPGEKIWFKAEVYNCLTEGLSTENELIIMLKGENGEVVTDNRYAIFDGICSNELSIPSWAAEGNAYLVAYTPKATKTNDALLAAVKPISINSLRKNDYIIDVVPNKKIYRPGEEIRLNIRLTSLTTASKREKMTIELFDQNQKKYSEKITVLVDSENEFKFKIPDKIDNGLYIITSLAGKNAFSNKIPIHTTGDNISIEFYPEGGTLLANNIQRILYRATDPFGKPVDISGNVFDERGSQAGAGKTIKKGYGLISLMPMPGQKYVFRIDDEYGKDLSFEIPEAQTDGSVFSLIKTEDSTLKASIFTCGKYSTQIMTLVAVSKGKIVFTSEIDGSKKNNLKIATSSLPEGVVDFVIFAADGKILSERLVFNTPNRETNIDIETKFTPSEKNGEVQIAVDLTKFIGRFGPSKVDVKVVDKYNLFEIGQPLNQSFLKYPLQTAIPQTVLDIYLTNLELIANEMKHFSLNDLVAGKDYLKQELGKSISGTVIDKNRRTVSNATVMAIQPNHLMQATTTTDSKGHFSFEGISKTDDVIIKAVSSSGKKTYTVHLDQTFNESLDEIILLESFRSKPAYNTPEYIRYCRQNKELLKLIGTEHKDSKPEKISDTERMLQSGSTILDVIKMTKPFRLDGNQIVFYGTTNSFNFQSGALIVIDGQKMGTDISALNLINPSDVKSINISTNPVDIQRYTGLNSVGLIEITTRGKSFADKQEHRNGGITTGENFGAKGISYDVWRYQTTLVWENNLPPDENGKLELDFPVSEIQTEFVVTVDVVSNEGIKYRETTTFSTIR